MPEREPLRRRIIIDFVIMLAVLSAFVFALALNIKPGHVDFTPLVVVAVLAGCAVAAGIAVSPKVARLRRLGRGSDPHA